MWHSNFEIRMPDQDIASSLTGEDQVARFGLPLSEAGRSWLAVVTFGGAYAVLAYVAQEAAGKDHWLSAPEMMAGLGLAERKQVFFEQDRLSS